MPDAINVQYDQYSIIRPFGKWRSLEHCKGGKSSDFLNEDCLTVNTADSASRAHNCKLLQYIELHEQLNYKSMEIKWYKYMKYGAKGC